MNVSYSLGKDVSLGVMTWPGFFLGREPSSFQNDGVTNPEKLKVGWFELASLNVSHVSVFVSHVNFLDTPNNWLPGVGYNQALGGGIELNTSAMWNTNADRAMYYIGATWRPPHK